jgi:hypothetical protein
MSCKSKLVRPIPHEIGNLMLTIVRNKSGFNRWKPTYTLVIYVKNGKKDCECKELLVGKKRGNNKKITYLISLDIKNPKPSGDLYCGKVKQVNKKDHNFVIYDDGLNPKKERKPKWRRTLCELTFVNEQVENFGKIRMINSHMVPIEGKFVQGKKYEDYLKLETHEIIRLMKTVVFCQTKMPTYDKDKGKHVTGIL